MEIIKFQFYKNGQIENKIGSIYVNKSHKFDLVPLKFHSSCVIFKGDNLSASASSD